MFSIPLPVMQLLKKNKDMIKKVFVMVSFMGILLLPLKGQNTYTLKNQNIEFTIDDNGNMLVMKNLTTGDNYASGMPMWRIYFDRTNEKDIEVLARENKPVIKQKGNSILIVYNELKYRNKSVKMSVSLEIVLEEKMVRFCSEISNSEPHTIVREIQYPLVGNCQAPADHQLLTTFRGGHIYPDIRKKILSASPSYKGPDQKFRQLDLTYPMGVASNCYALIGTEQGLYFGSHDSTFQYTCHGIRLYPDSNGVFNQVETGLYKYPNCQYGERWSNDANVIAPYCGDWHSTSEIYRTWANTWWSHREEPEWVKNMIGFQRVILRHQNGETLYTYQDFPGRIKKAGESVGINVAFPFGWWNSGMDNGYPDSYYVTDTAQGGDKAWKQAITDFRSDGGRVIMYVNGKLIDTESDFYKNGFQKGLCYVSSNGTELTEAYKFPGGGTFTGYFNNRSFVVADTRNPGWQQELKKMADRAYDLGADCVFYDQLGYVETASNWDLSKEFPVLRMNIIADKANALKLMHDYIETKDKDFAIGTEHITDVTSQYVDFVHGIYGLSGYTTTPHTNFIDWFRYTFPEVILTDRDIYGNEPNIKWLTNRAVLLGLRTNLQIYRLRGLVDDTPVYQNYLSSVNKIVERYGSLLLSGTYRDNEGFTLSSKNVEARSYVNGNRMAVVVTHNQNKAISARIDVPGYNYLESDGLGEISVITDNNGVQELNIGIDGLVVLVYELQKR